MDFSKLKNRLLIVLCVFIVLFPFWCIRGLCSEEEAEILEYSTINGLSINASRNFFATASSGGVGYVELEKGYKYIFTNTSSDFSRNLAVSSDIPALNGVYKYLANVAPNESYEYIPYDDTYLYFDWFSASGQVSRIKLTSLDGAVSSLVDNVGINSIWNIFDISINYIVIVVLVAFGIFIISLVIRKISKGKEGL